MKESPESKRAGAAARLKPTKWDALVVLAVLALAVLLGARVWFAPSDSGALRVAVAIDGEVVEHLPFGNTERDYHNNGYTVHVVVTSEGVYVDHADCPTQDCVRTGTVSRAGQSIVCLPARVVITVEGGAADYDAIVG